MQMQTVPNEEKSNLFLQATISKVAKKLSDRDKGKKIKYFLSLQSNDKWKQYEIDGKI